MPRPLLSLIAAALALPPQSAAWTPLRETDIARVECARAGDEPWCRSHGVVEAPLPVVEGLLRDFSSYTRTFPRVVACDPLGDDLVRVQLDMPAPLSDRDYVARFTRSEEGEAVVFRWVAGEHPQAPPLPGVVRLPRSAGEWRLSPLPGGRTAITYTWQGELGGDVPEWAWPRAWGIQGEEVMGWLGEAAARQGAG